MLGRLFGDWKFLLMLVATVAVPIWLWQADHGGKSISMRLISQVSLRPVEKDAVPGLQISVKGVALSDPYFSVVEVLNDGDKPILSSDFDLPLEIRPLTKSSIAGAHVTAKTPADIDADIIWNKQSVTLKPALLNPHDAITISIITSGGQPSFSTRARIVGVSSVPIADATKKATQNPWSRMELLFITLLCAIPATAVQRRLEIFSRRKEKNLVVLGRGMAFAIVIITGLGAMFGWLNFLETYGITSFWSYYLSGMLLLVVISVLGARFDSIPPTTESGTNPKP